MSYPANYRYTREHEWIELNGAIGTIGITDYAQNSLGDIVYVDVPKVGDSATANATFGSVESVKAVSDLYSPVSGTVTAINEVDHQGRAFESRGVQRPARHRCLRGFHFRRNGKLIVGD
jgi:glycine cleavage system H protein